jgi:hypothetical protein
LKKEALRAFYGQIAACLAREKSVFIMATYMPPGQMILLPRLVLFSKDLP